MYNDILGSLTRVSVIVWEQLKQFLRKKPCCNNKQRWEEKDGIISFTLPATDGTTGPQWIERLEKKNFRIGDYAKQVLCSTDFKPTVGIVNNIAVLKGELFSSDDNRITKNIRTEADKRKLSKPNAELACLIRENFSNKEIEAMGLVWIISMHEPIKDSYGDSILLSADRDYGGPSLLAYHGNPDDRWCRERGFAFVASQETLASGTQI